MFDLFMTGETCDVLPLPNRRGRSEVRMETLHALSGVPCSHLDTVYFVSFTLYLTHLKIKFFWNFNITV